MHEAVIPAEAPAAGPVQHLRDHLGRGSRQLSGRQQEASLQAPGEGLSPPWELQGVVGPEEGAVVERPATRLPGQDAFLSTCSRVQGAGDPQARGGGGKAAFAWGHSGDMRSVPGEGCDVPDESEGVRGHSGRDGRGPQAECRASGVAEGQGSGVGAGLCDVRDREVGCDRLVRLVL